MARKKKFMFLAGTFRNSANALSGFARKMLERGHEVLVVGPEKHREAAVRNRLPFEPAGSDLTADPQVARDLGNLRYGDGDAPGDNDAFNRELVGNHLPRHAENLVGRLDEIVERFGPDAIFHDVTVPGWIAERYGVSGAPVDSGMGPVIARLHTDVMGPAINRIRAELGLPEEPASSGRLLTPDPGILFGGSDNVQGFQPPPGRSRGAVPPGAYQTDGLKAYVSLGPAEWRGSKFDAAVLRATELAVRSLERFGIDSVVAVGPGEASRYRHLAGDHVLIEEIADQLACMEKADFAILDGGYGGILNALSSKGKGRDPVPVLYVPQHGDQVLRAKELDRRGLGLTVDPNNCSPSEFTEKVQQIIDERAELAEASRVLQAGLDGHLTVDEVADSFVGPVQAPEGTAPTLPPEGAGPVVIQARVVESSYGNEGARDDGESTGSGSRSSTLELEAGADAEADRSAEAGTADADGSAGADSDAGSSDADRSEATAADAGPSDAAAVGSEAPAATAEVEVEPAAVPSDSEGPTELGTMPEEQPVEAEPSPAGQPAEPTPADPEPGSEPIAPPADPEPTPEREPVDGPADVEPAPEEQPVEAEPSPAGQPAEPTPADPEPGSEPIAPPADPEPTPEHEPVDGPADVEEQPVEAEPSPAGQPAEPTPADPEPAEPTAADPEPVAPPADSEPTPEREPVDGPADVERTPEEQPVEPEPTPEGQPIEPTPADPEPGSDPVAPPADPEATPEREPVDGPADVERTPEEQPVEPEPTPEGQPIEPTPADPEPGSEPVAPPADPEPTPEREPVDQPVVPEPVAPPEEDEEENGPFGFAF